MFSRILRRFTKAAPLLALCCTAGTLAGQSANTGNVQPVGSEWPTYNGDYSGKRFSSLAQINKANVAGLTLAWAYQTHATSLKSTPLMVNGVVYFNVPDHVWAVDAKTGARIWDFDRPSQGNHVGGRGVAFYRNRVYVGTPDAHLICLDARDGKPIWEVTVADVSFGYYIGLAPLVVGDKILVGPSGDATDVPHALYAFDWQTGKEAWHRSSLPLPGEPGADTWPNANAMAHGGGPMWMTGTYDPDLGLLYWGTGNPHPVLAGDTRKGDDLYTCTILALHADTGKMAWYFQASPHDTHDWDAVETPVLFDATVAGQPRKLLAQASRNGFYFVLDRVTGRNITSVSYTPTDWAAGIDSKGQPIPKPEKEPKVDGSLIHSVNIGGTNWMPPSLDPQTGLFYVSALEGYSFWYIVVDQQGLPEDHQGGGSVPLASKASLLALDAVTGKLRWRRDEGAGSASPGILTTAGQLLFTGDTDGNLLALDAATGAPLWHTRAGGNLNSSPMTYEVDGVQYVLTGVDGVLYAWRLPTK